MKPQSPISIPVLMCCLVLLATVAPAAEWPQWRGPDRTGRVPTDPSVPTTIPAEPKRVWQLEIGGGFSSPVVSSNRLVYLDGQDKQEVAHLIDAGSGKEIWRTAYADLFEDEWGPGPRSTPIIDDDRVYAQSCSGEFRCLNLADGKTIWGINFDKDFGVKFLGSKAREGTASRRGNNGCAVIDGENIIVPVGSTDGATIVCFN
ncbi:MAG: qbdA, partial [Pedosphaera sp.]|nr:qbdA [Pedosphaera sp.]